MKTLRRLLPYTSVALIAALAYAGWTFLARSRAARVNEQAAEAEKAKADERIVKAYGDGHLKILTFYASPATVKRGEKALLCYGVANAKSVSIKPDVEGVSPALSRCLDIAPKATTEYTFEAQDASGAKETRSFVLTVR